MFNNLYLLRNEKKDWWQLRVADSHFCLACGTGEEYIKECLRKLVKKYRNEMRLQRALEDIDGGAISRNEVEFQRQKDLFAEQGEVYYDVVRQVVREALKEVQSDTPVLRNARKFKKVDLEVEEVNTTPPLEEEESTPSRLLVTKPLINLTIKKLRVNL